MRLRHHLDVQRQVTDDSHVNMLVLRYNFVNFGAKKDLDVERQVAIPAAVVVVVAFIEPAKKVPSIDHFQ